MTSESYSYGFSDFLMQSPSGTPQQSTSFSPFVFQTPSTSESSSPNFGLTWTPVHTQKQDAGHQFQVPKIPSTPQYHNQNNTGVPASASSLKRPRPDSLQNIGKDAFKIPDSTPTTAAAEPERFLSQSFLEQFDETTLHDSFTTGGVQTLKSTPYAQMQTPPPTRDASTRRKAQQSQSNEQVTPSTIASRRMSVAGEAWRQKTGGQTPMEASPYQFTPLQITPPVRAEIYNMGPTTAPVFSQSGMLWDNHTAMQSAHNPYLVLGDDPFVATSFSAGLPMNPPMQQRSSKPTQVPTRLTIPQHQVADVGRPHSAGPVSLRQNAMLPPSTLSASASVDPNMLWMSKNVGNASRARSNTIDIASTMENKQPYQYHLDQMKREKNLEKSRKVTRQPQQPPLQPIVPSTQPFNAVSKLATSEIPRSGLRRSLTDSKIRPIPEPLPRPASVCSVDGHDLADGLMLATIPRTSSPLKRYKAEAFKSAFAQNTQHRQSVILTVDDKGRARTQVTTVGNTPVDMPIPEDDDDEPEEDKESPVTMKASSTASHKPAVPKSLDCNDAQDALRQVVQERQRRKQSQAPQMMTQNYPMVRSQSASAGHLMNFEQRKNTTLYPSNITLPSSIPAYPVSIDHIENISPNNISPNNISPSTISEQELYTPNGYQGLGSTCICGIPGDNGQPMIRCECCFKWMHMTCVGLHPNHPPHLLPPYVCMSCASASMFNAGGHIQMYPGMI